MEKRNTDNIFCLYKSIPIKNIIRDKLTGFVWVFFRKHISITVSNTVNFEALMSKNYDYADVI